ncbi:YwpF family protein [Virgibacillus sp. LDC-1]|uniref:YwpF family protein n=1 Tax=Virgibacillus sp. LDC-1 TaxID=3039856 RepID=UPI0024DE78B0|nr:YwpF family protein [Virgibacillus sp. LDC-1]
MKTFKLKSLKIKESVKDELFHHDIELMDGLIINREDEKNRWITEAYMDKRYYDLIHRLREERDELMIEVKITKESNSPATFISKIISINDIGEHINVLFMGTIIDQRIQNIEQMLRDLINQGYHGEELLTQFKALI